MNALSVLTTRLLQSISGEIQYSCLFSVIILFINLLFCTILVYLVGPISLLLFSFLPYLSSPPSVKLFDWNVFEIKFRFVIPYYIPFHNVFFFLILPIPSYLNFASASSLSSSIHSSFIRLPFLSPLPPFLHFVLSSRTLSISSLPSFPYFPFFASLCTIPTHFPLSLTYLFPFSCIPIFPLLSLLLLPPPPSP
jgi:hypothetical protein